MFFQKINALTFLWLTHGTRFFVVIILVFSLASPNGAPSDHRTRARTYPGSASPQICKRKHVENRKKTEKSEQSYKIVEKEDIDHLDICPKGIYSVSKWESKSAFSVALLYILGKEYNLWETIVK